MTTAEVVAVLKKAATSERRVQAVWKSDFQEPYKTYLRFFVGRSVAGLMLLPRGTSVRGPIIDPSGIEEAHLLTIRR